MTAVLEVTDLSVRFTTDAGVVPAVNGVSFTLGRGAAEVPQQSLPGKKWVNKVGGRVNEIEMRFSRRLFYSPPRVCTATNHPGHCLDASSQRL